jgi:hypothetical protein
MVSAILRDDLFKINSHQMTQPSDNFQNQNPSGFPPNNIGRQPTVTIPEEANLIIWVVSARIVVDLVTNCVKDVNTELWTLYCWLIPFSSFGSLAFIITT